MALSKRIAFEGDGGVATNYHRIACLTIITNQTNLIEVASYTSKAKRQEESRAIAEGQRTGIAVPMDVLVLTHYFNAPYDQNMTVADAYDWLKENVPEFEAANESTAEGEE